MRPLAFEGILVTNCYAILRKFLAQNAAFLKQHGMPDAASLLAEPAFDAATGQINWYTTINGLLHPISYLPPKDQILVRAKIDKYLATFRELIKSEAGKENKTASSLLALAIQHPSEQDIYVHDLTPVLINWGFEASSLSAVPGNAAVPQAGAAAAVPGTTVPPVSPQVVTKHTSGWAGWIPPFILLLLLLWLNLAALDILPSPLPASLFHQDVSTDQEEARSRGLQEQTQNVYAKLLARCLQCQPKQPAAETPAEKPAAAPEQPKEDPVQPAEALKPVPDEKEPTAEAAKPESEEEPVEEIKPLAQNEIPNFGDPAVLPAEQTPKGSAMQIPEDAAKNNDLSFLEGCWRSVTELHNSVTGEPVEAEYCFQSNGEGLRRVIGKNGGICSGSASANFSGSKLVITGGKASCKHGPSFVRQKVQCRGTGSSTHCSGQEIFRGRITNRWDAVFIRK